MAENTTPASKSAPKTTEHTVVQFVGHVGTRRVISKEDQDALLSVKGVGKHDLVWEAGNGKLDVTDLGLHEDVLAYLNSDPEFKVKTVSVEG